MRKTKITAGGQISLPASVRRRWGTRFVALEDLGDRVVVTPIPEDPIAAARGLWKGLLPPTEELRAQARRDEQAAEDAKLRRLYGRR